MKKVFCAVIAVTFVFLTVMPAFAAQDCDCGKIPLVLVSGMNTYPLYLDKGTENEKQVFPPVVDINDILLKGTAGLLSAAVFRDWNKFGDVFIPMANDLLEPVAFNPDGTTKYNVTTATFPDSLVNYPGLASGGNEFGLLHTACDKLGADHVYFFNYDWREDPMKNAVDLNTMIEKAKIQTGHSKVDIAACSLGAPQILAYMVKYGTADLDSCVFLSPMLSGAYIASDCMTNRIEVDHQAIIRYLNHNMKSADGSKSPVTVIMEVLDFAGLLKPALDLLNNGIDAMYNRISDELVIDIFATMPGIWSAMRADSYETAKQNLLDPAEHAELIEKIDYFHYNVRLKTAEILQNAMESGVKVSVVSHYNTPAIPIFESANETGDGVLDTYCTSGGAFCAPMGEVLPAGYVQKYSADGKNYISPDRIIDASACLLPEKVWFVKNLRHVGCPYNSEYNEFVFWLLESKTQQTVWSDAQHPQFMSTGDGGMTLTRTETAKDTDLTVNYLVSIFKIAAAVVLPFMKFS